jgi:predicted transcriptional regulator
MNLYSLNERINLKELQLNKHLALLENSGLIRIQNFGNHKTFFELTESGLTVLKMNRSLLSEAQDSQRNELKTIKIPL